MQISSLKSEIIRTENCFNQVYNQHCHAHYEVLFVLKGSIKLNIEGRHIVLGEEAGIVIEPMQYHIVTGNNTAYHRLILFFEQDIIPSEIAKSFAESVHKNAVFSALDITRYFRKYASLLEQQNTTYRSLLNAVLTEAIYALTFQNSKTAEIRESGRIRKLEQIVSYIDDHLDRELTLEEIATKMYMSQSAVCHLFKAEMSISLKQYILHKKMIYAETLLRRGTTPSATAIACGYKNYPSFYKIFLKITGKSPAEVKETTLLTS